MPPRSPTFFVHGFLGAPASWQPVRSLLPAHPQDVALLLPGHGPEPRPVPQTSSRPRSSSAFAAVAAALWQDVQAPRGVLVGYSLGARLALAMALIAPERVAHLILIGANPGLEGAVARRVRRRRDAAWAARLRAAGLEDFLAAWEAQPLFASQHQLPEAARRAQALSRRQHQAESLAQAIECLSPGRMPVLSQRLEELLCPIDWVAGAEDPGYVARARQMVQRHPTSRCFVIDRAGHNVVLEAPAAIVERIEAAHRPKKTDPHP